MKKKNFVIHLTFLIGILCLGQMAHSQKKTKEKPKQEVEAKKELPPAEELQDTKIVEILSPAEKIDFDTTAVPEDRFTDSIRKLLVIINAKKKDLEQGEKALRQAMASYLADPLTHETGEKFIAKFLKEMDEGRAKIWLENVYVRAYRSLFTIDEIHTCIDFYQTPAGKKSLERTTLLLEMIRGEASKIGAYLGEEIMASILAEEKNK